MIVTKSISRFARNTVDCLHYVRMLKALGIAVIFEKENINTNNIPNEMLLTILSWFAQAESESISQNVTWGKQQSMKKGNVTFNYSNFLGYEKGEDGKPKIVPAEAETIRRIFKNYLAGHSIVRIKQDLENDGIFTKKGKPEWSPNAIRFILNNEKYAGDSLLQKTYVSDVLTHKVKKNNGELPQYLVKNSHVGIIDRDTFRLVQEETARRTSKRKVSDKTITELSRYSSIYALTDILICGGCGTPYKRVTWARNGNKKIVWRCINRLDYGTKYCKNSPSMEETKLQNAIMQAINAQYDDNDGTKEMVIANLRAALSGKDGGVDIVTIDNRIKELQNEMLELAKSNPAGYEKFKEISDEIKAHQETKQKYEVAQNNSVRANAQINQICTALESMSTNITVWNEQLVRSLIQTVKVLSNNKILIIFNDGTQMEENI